MQKQSNSERRMVVILREPVEEKEQEEKVNGTEPGPDPHRTRRRPHNVVIIITQVLLATQLSWIDITISYN